MRAGSVAEQRFPGRSAASQRSWFRPRAAQGLDDLAKGPPEVGRASAQWNQNHKHADRVAPPRPRRRSKQEGSAMSIASSASERSERLRASDSRAGRRNGNSWRRLDAHGSSEGAAAGRRAGQETSSGMGDSELELPDEPWSVRRHVRPCALWSPGTLQKCAREQLGLDRVLWMVAGDPWRKREQDVSHAKHRVEMVRTRLSTAIRHSSSGPTRSRAKARTYTVETVAGAES